MGTTLWVNMEIENWRDGASGSNVIGIFDVYFGSKFGMRFKNLKAIRSKKGATFINYPCFCVERDGQKNWVPYFSFAPEKELEFKSQLQELVKPFTERQSMGHKQPEYEAAAPKSEEDIPF